MIKDLFNSDFKKHFLTFLTFEKLYHLSIKNGRNVSYHHGQTYFNNVFLDKRL